MWPGIIAIGLIFLTILFFIVVMAPFLIEAAINGVILWIVLTRGYYDIMKRNEERYFAYGAVVGVITMFIISFQKLGSIWWITTFCLAAFISAKAIAFFDKRYGKR